jgi:hypothetical protein
MGQQWNIPGAGSAAGSGSGAGSGAGAGSSAAGTAAEPADTRNHASSAKVLLLWCGADICKRCICLIA